MTLSPNTEFETSDPAALKADLRTEHRDVYEETRRLDQAKSNRWAQTLVGTGDTVRAVRDGFYAGDTFTVMTPGNPLPGDCFRVATNGVGAGVSLLSDDGTSINGNPGFDSLGGVSGCREYQFVESPNTALRGWLRVGV